MYDQYCSRQINLSDCSIHIKLNYSAIIQYLNHYRRDLVIRQCPPSLRSLSPHIRRSQGYQAVVQHAFLSQPDRSMKPT
jgi:hypothetical protein